MCYFFSLTHGTFYRLHGLCKLVKLGFFCEAGVNLLRIENSNASMKKALEKVHVVAEVEEGAAAVVGEGAPKADAGRDARDVGREEAYSAVVVDPLCATQSARMVPAQGRRVGKSINKRDYAP